MRSLILFRLDNFTVINFKFGMENHHDEPEAGYKIKNNLNEENVDNHKIIENKLESTDHINKMNESISVKDIFSKMTKIIKEKNILFVCKGKLHNEYNCNTTLFLSPEIISIYVLDEFKFSYVIDPKEITNRIFNISFKSEVFFNDEKINQHDCMYKHAICKICGEIIGRYFIGVSSEKQFLLEKIIIFPELIGYSYEINETSNTTIINVSSYINYCNANEIKQFKEATEKLAESYALIKDHIKKSKIKNSIMAHLKDTEDYLDSLIRYSKYLNYYKSINKLPNY